MLATRPVDDAAGLLTFPAALPRGLHRLEALRDTGLGGHWEEGPTSPGAAVGACGREKQVRGLTGLQTVLQGT